MCYVINSGHSQLPNFMMLSVPAKLLKYVSLFLFVIEINMSYHLFISVF